jgi:hypothetical protein
MRVLDDVMVARVARGMVATIGVVAAAARVQGFVNHGGGNMP